MALLTRMFAIAMSCHPLVSVNVNVYCCGMPIPGAGLTPPTPGPVWDPPGTAHVASACQPEFVDEVFPAERYTTLFPAKLALNAIARVKVRVFPLPLTALKAPLIEHWLLLKVPPPGNTIP